MLTKNEIFVLLEALRALYAEGIVNGYSNLEIQVPRQRQTINNETINLIRLEKKLSRMLKGLNNVSTKK